MSVNDQININEYFNGFNVRIIGTNDLPMFYANDIGEILGIDQIRHTLSSFGPDDLISSEQRVKYNITTYRSDGKKNNRMHLLTLQGVIRLINISRKTYANDFRKYIATIVNKIRLQQQADTNISLNFNSNKTLEKPQETESGNLMSEESRFNASLVVKTNLRPLYIFEHKCNSTKNQQTLSDIISDSEDEDIEDEDNILYIQKQAKRYPKDPYWIEKLELNTIDHTIQNTSYLVVTDNQYSKLYLNNKLETTLYTTDPEKTIKYLRKQWSSFVGSSQKLKDQLLLNMEKEYFIKDLKHILTCIKQ